MTGHPAIADAATPDWTAVAQGRLAAPVPALLAPSAVHNQSAPSSMTDMLHAALGTALAAAWLMGAAWVGIRSARGSTPLNQSGDQTRNERRLRFM
jgi:hypothetical protein